jgi:SAM-dependent methyltransferase
MRSKNNYGILMPRYYVPAHPANRMKFEGDCLHARTEYLARKSNNLSFLLHQRYAWMNKYINPEALAIEIGCGAGLSTFFLESPKVILTDVVTHPWVDICVDATNLPFGPSSVDVIICVNVLHHVPSPIRFLEDAQRCLKPDGYLLIHEPNPSTLLLLALRIMHHEGWAFDIDVFNPEAQVNNPCDAWSGNNAISHLLFHDSKEFVRRCSGFRLVYDCFTECLLFPLSGGVTAKFKTLELPLLILRGLAWVDKILCRMAPSFFSMGRSVALQKVPLN